MLILLPSITIIFILIGIHERGLREAIKPALASVLICAATMMIVNFYLGHIPVFAQVFISLMYTISQCLCFISFGSGTDLKKVVD